MPAQITLPIVGVQFPNAKGMTRRYAVELHRPGDPVELRREPKNPADPNAIAVFSLVGVQMGYIPAERAPYVGMMMGRGEVRAVFQGQSEHGAWLRVAFDGDEPVLPPASPPRAAEPDWWPDPEWADDVWPRPCCRPAHRRPAAPYHGAREGG